MIVFFQSLRIILASIESHANRYKRYIVPVLSCSIDFYCRVFVLVYTSAYEVKKSAWYSNVLLLIIVYSVLPLVS